MQLLYLWIDSYNNISNQPFQFTNEYEIKFDKDSDTLEISKSQSNKLNLFNSSFLNITAIIGRNGSGKSSLLSFFKLIFNNASFLHYPYILIFRDKNNKILVIDNLLEKKDKKVICKGDVSATILNDIDILRQNIDVIIQSNSFSIFENEFNESSVIDISLNNSIIEYSKESNKQLVKTIDELQDVLDIKNEVEYEALKRSKEFYIDRISPLRDIYKYNLLANMKFISEFQNESWDFIPKKFEFSFSEIFFYNNRNFFESQLGDSLTADISNLFGVSSPKLCFV